MTATSYATCWPSSASTSSSSSTARTSFRKCLIRIRRSCGTAGSAMSLTAKSRPRMAQSGTSGTGGRFSSTPKARHRSPLAIDPQKAVVHKIIVAHGAKEACEQASEQNIYGSLAITYCESDGGSTHPSTSRSTSATLFTSSTAITCRSLWASWIRSVTSPTISTQNCGPSPSLIRSSIAAKKTCSATTFSTTTK